MINNAVIMGRLTADPELRTTGNGITVTDLIGFITIYRKEVEKDLVKLEKKVGEDGEV